MTSYNYFLLIYNFSLLLLILIPIFFSVQCIIKNVMELNQLVATKSQLHNLVAFSSDY